MLKRKKGLICACVIIVIVSRSGRAQWESISHLNFAREGITAVVLDDYIYAIGGDSGPGMVSNAVERYDPAVNQWMVVDSLNHPRTYAAAAVSVSDEIFVFGGKYDDFTMVSTVEKYNPNFNEWVDVAELPYPREGLAAVRYLGEILVIGGYSPTGGYFGRVDVFDPETYGFTQTYPDLNPQRAGHAAAAGGGRLRVVGGVFFGLLDNNTTWNDSLWVDEAPLMTARCNLAAVLFGDSLIALCGNDGFDALNTAECYCLSSGQWSIFPSLNYTRQGLAAVELNGNIYAIGGYGNIPSQRAYYLSTVEKYSVPISDIEDRNQPVLIPAECGLFCYPNPFNSKTNIKFELPNSGEVSLVVYDIEGKEVCRLIDGWKNAGVYEVEFKGEGLSSGVYLIALDTGILKETKKVALVK
jgi:hypothetical protein